MWLISLPFASKYATADSLNMDEDTAEVDSGSRIMENNQSQNTQDHPKCNNFSIESILSSASSALAMVSNQDAKKSYEHAFDLHTNLLRKGITKSNNEELTNESENNREYESNKELDCIDDEDEDVDVESRSPSPTLHPHAPSIFDRNQSNGNLPMFGLSKGNCSNQVM